MGGSVCPAAAKTFTHTQTHTDTHTPQPLLAHGCAHVLPSTQVLFSQDNPPPPSIDFLIPSLHWHFKVFMIPQTVGPGDPATLQSDAK